MADLGAELLGDALWDTYGGWPMYSKFFDNKGALPHHLHQMEEHAAAVGQKPKPEAYYFSPQMNNYGADYPYTFFGLEPGTTKEEVRGCLERWDEGDNGIRYPLQGLPAGAGHGLVCARRPPARAGQSLHLRAAVGQRRLLHVPVAGQRGAHAWENLVKDVPEDKKQDLDYIISMVDWDANVNPNLKDASFRPPLPVRPLEEMESEGYVEKWITYGNEYIAAKELTVLPGSTVTIQDAGPYGFITVQGHGTHRRLGDRDAGADPLRPVDERRVSSSRTRLRRKA